jgi:hypothetical protein
VLWIGFWLGWLGLAGFGWVIKRVSLWVGKLEGREGVERCDNGDIDGVMIYLNFCLRVKCEVIRCLLRQTKTAVWITWISVCVCIILGTWFGVSW